VNFKALCIVIFNSWLTTDIDAPPAEDEVVAARGLIEREASKSLAKEDLHPSISKLDKSYLTDAIKHQLNEIENGSKLEDGIDLTRYSNLFDKNGQLKLREAYVALGYSELRQEDLSLLAEYGKNQWLIGNDNLERTLQQAETTLQDIQMDIDRINSDRKRRQEDALPTLEYLEARWRAGIRNTIDVNIACLQLENEIKKLRKE
jgi:pre-mRNA-splicing factor SPF27